MPRGEHQAVGQKKRQKRGFIMGRSGRSGRKSQGSLVVSGRKFIRYFGLWPLRMVCRYVGLQTETAMAPRHLEEVYALRHRIYVEEGFIDPCPDQTFRDEFDHWSENILVRREGIPVATCRLILGAHPAFRGFWTSSLFAIRDLPPVAETAEVSRFGVDQNYRGNGNILFLALLLAIYDSAHRHRFRYILLNMPTSLARMIQRQGLHPQAVTPDAPQAQHLENRKLIGGYFERKNLVPFLIDLNETLPAFGLKPIQQGQSEIA